LYGAGFLLVLLSLTTSVFAGISTVPEIDGGSVAAGLGLLAGSVLMLRARLGRK
jgi:hypothetical protein